MEDGTRHQNAQLLHTEKEKTIQSDADARRPYD